MATIPVHAGDNLQTIINNAALGDTLVLDTVAMGAVFHGPINLPDKGAGTAYITIQSASMNLLPPGVRVGPADAPNMWRVTTPGANLDAMHTALSAHHYQLLGGEICPIDATVAPGELLKLGNGGGTQSSTPLIAHHLIVDRCYIHANPTQGCKRGISLQSANTDIVNSYISDIHLVGQDSQAICGWQGPGPFNILNNYIEGAAENMMFGGADPVINGLIPSDILVQNNTFFKPLTWREKIQGQPNPVYAGIHWEVKNLFEIKNAQRVTLDGNVFENSWADAQTGIALSLKGTEQNHGLAPWSICKDVVIKNNIIRGCGQGMTIAGQTNQSVNMTIANNLWQNVNGAQWGSGGVFAQVQNILNLTMDHNSSDSDGNIITFPGLGGTTPRLTVNFNFTDNIIPRSVNSFGVKGAGFTEGTGSLGGFCDPYSFTGNTLVSTVGGLAARYPGGNTVQAALPTAIFLGALSATQVTNASVSLSMTMITPGSGVCTYQLQRAPALYGNPGAWSDIGAPLTNQHGGATFVDATVAAATTYFYRIYVLDTVGASLNTNLLQVLTGTGVIGGGGGGGVGGGGGTPPPPPPVVIPPPPVVTPPPSGTGGGGTPPTPPPPTVAATFISFQSAAVPIPVGKIPYVYLARTDMFQIAILDTRTMGYVAPIVYGPHTITGDDPHRNNQKRLYRIKVSGTGVIDPTPGMAYMSVIADGARSDFYPYVPQATDPALGYLWAQDVLPLLGKTFDVTLYLAGTGIVITELKCEYTVVN